jgi:hypothetical protein
MPRWLIVIVGLSVALLALAACGNDEATHIAVTPTPAGSPNESAAAFFKRHVQYGIKGEWRRDWDELHPLHQRLISRSQYDYCQSGEVGYVGDEIVRVTDTYESRNDVLGIPQQKTMAAEIELGRPGATGGATYTLQALRVGGRWRWLLFNEAVKAYRRGECLDGTKLPRASG